jgi:ssDNA-binding Zn-finger/Zn-ribbon topoisomerase 1
MNPTPIICLSCGNGAIVDRVTAGITCKCGSRDIDLFEDTPAQKALRRRYFASQRPTQVPSFAEFMTGKTARELPQTVVPGWDEYQGPMPGPNPTSNGVATPLTCSVCHGSKFDIQDGGPCRECGGQGVMTAPTTPKSEPQVARHPYPSTQTIVPLMGRKKKAGRPSSQPGGSVEEHIKATTPGYSDRGGAPPNAQGMYPSADTMSPHARTWSPASPIAAHTSLPLTGSSCPTCGKSPLMLQTDHKDDAWVGCPDCGPLYNQDRNLHLDPYNLDDGFSPAKGYKAVAKVFSPKKTGRVLKMALAVRQKNSGLSTREVVGLVRETLRRYPETR